MNYIEPIHADNLSDAWARVFDKCCAASGSVLNPGIVSFNVREEDETWELERLEIRQALEAQLSALGICSVNQSNIETVAGTIFPDNVWRRCGGNHQILFSEYEKMWPYISKCPNAANNRGTYFRRLTAFGQNRINQLAEILDAWNIPIRRHSAFQAGIFDPAQDHRKTPYLRFPCLQQVVFHPMGPNGSEGMHIVALYVNQSILEKAYGNYLGLYRLGQFMAGKMGLKLKGVTCISTNLSLSYKFNKSKCAPLLKDIRKALHDDK